MSTSPRALTEDEKLVRACLRVAGERRMDPFLVARAVNPDWTRDRWDTSLVAYETGELERRGHQLGGDEAKLQSVNTGCSAWP